MSFESLGLSENVLRGVQAAGYTIPTEIQVLAIPPAVAGRDVIGRAQTGTGKTAAFAMPILTLLEAAGKEQPPGAEHGEPPHHPRRRPPRKPERPVRVLVLTPTRELAHQIDDAFREYAKFTPFESLAVYGGVRYAKQMEKLREGVDIVVATPGRLLDYMGRRTIDVGHVEFLVLDEVDRMFDMGFIHDVRRIVSALPERRQTLLFSATVPSAVKRLAERLQRPDAVLVEVGEQRNPIETVTQYVYPTQSTRKLDLLRFILEDKKLTMVLVFCATKDNADFVTRRLQHGGVDAAQLHSNLSQGERQAALDGFKSGEHRVLVATDIAARGLDIEGISHVVNFDVPRYAQDYIHRVGRTGRATALGDAITLVGYEEEEFFTRIEEFIGMKLERLRYKDFDHGVVKLQKSPVSARRGGKRRGGKRRYV